MKTQYIKIDEEGNKFYYSDAAMTIRHRVDGPAIEYADGHKEWCVNGKPHRTNGPAIEYVDGSKSWYVKGERHRVDGPAVELADGFKSWWINGKLHREDGPAVEHVDGPREWYVDGKKLTEEQFNARFAAVELTLEDIAAKFGVDVNNLKIIK